MESDVIVRYYRKKINEFDNVITKFCADEGIPCHINNALWYKANIGVGTFWKYLYAAPKIYLANSKSFLRYRETLDPDFRDEILTTEEIFSFQQEAIKNKFIKTELQKKMKNDFIQN